MSGRIIPFSSSPDQAGNAQYPAFNLRHNAFRRGQIGLQQRPKAAIPVGAGEPSGDAIGVVLVRRAALGRKAAAPQRRVDLGEGRTPHRDSPTVERPEMDAAPEVLPDKA